MSTLPKDYKLIPFDEITPEARELAVKWGENMRDDFIAQKHKLASDIMNYARVHARENAGSDATTLYNALRKLLYAGQRGFEEFLDAVYEAEKVIYEYEKKIKT